MSTEAVITPDEAMTAIKEELLIDLANCVISKSNQIELLKDISD